MYVYRPTKKFNYTPVKKKDESRFLDNKELLKQYNINFDMSEETMVRQLQQSLGNKAALVMLKELGKVGFDDTTSEKGKNDTLKGQIVQMLDQDELNPSMARNKEVEEFKSLALEDNDKAQVAIHSGRFATKHNKRKKPTLMKSNFMNNFRGFLQMINVLKVYINRDEAKAIEVKEQDMLLKPNDEQVRSEIDMLFKMIRRLPDYNESSEEIMERYFRTYKFIIASGIDLNMLFQHNGSLKKQRELLLNSIQSK